MKAWGAGRRWRAPALIKGLQRFTHESTNTVCESKSRSHVSTTTSRRENKTMKGIDLKLTPEDAIHIIGREVDGAVERIRDAGEALVKQLTAANTTVKPIDIAKAEIAAVIDFLNSYDFGGHTQLTLNFNGNGGGYVDLHNGIRRGRYRALILIERLGDNEP